MLAGLFIDTWNSLLGVVGAGLARLHSENAAGGKLIAPQNIEGANIYIYKKVYSVTSN